MTGMQSAGNRISTCFLCDKAFEVTASRPLFCGEDCKELYARMNQSKCFYCGDIATDRDHVVPHALSGRNRRIWTLDWVHCCRECNRFMGAEAPYSMTERVRIVIGKISKKYKLDQPDPDWDEHDLEGMSRQFVAKIKADARNRTYAEGRIVMLKARLSDLIEKEIALIDRREDENDAA